MSTISKLGTGIQSPADSEDYFICKLCFRLVGTAEFAEGKSQAINFENQGGKKYRV